MAFTAKLGTNESYLSNIELGFGATPTPRAHYTGLYFISLNKANDTVYSNIDTGATEQRAIPNPFIETSLLTTGD